MADRAPAYVGARSANLILSSIRVTKIKTEALRSLNIFLDELLWLVLQSARSLSTDRLKAGLLQIMPSSVGKDAILEAEVELRAYRKRVDWVPPDAYDAQNQDFPLQPTFELLRQKCETYCTLGELQEDISTETALKEKLLDTPNAPRIEGIAPAALYLIVILEHIGDHVLNNVGQVVARDSSRATAHSVDLYTALCEDTAIYPLFKSMKVHEQIEAQSRAFRPSHRTSSSISGVSRTKSISRVRSGEDHHLTRKMSTPVQSTVSTDSSPTNTPAPFTRRPSADTVLATSQQAPLPSAVPGSSKSSLERTRASLERITGMRSMERANSVKAGDKNGRGMKLFRKGSMRISSDDGASGQMASFPGKEARSSPDERSTMSPSDGTRRPMVAFQTGSSPEQDAGDDSDEGPIAQDFDELMRSGATMKVSLTPDRLKTFEVFAKQKNQRLSRGHSQDGSSGSAPPLPPLYSNPSDMVLSQRIPSARREVDAIIEADESQARSRTQSLAPQFLSEEPKIPGPPVQTTSFTGRSRSHTESSSRPSVGSKPSSTSTLLRKASFNGGSRDRIVSDNTPPNEPSRTRKVFEAPTVATMSGPPPRKRGPARRRESMDLDDIINEPLAPRRGGSNSALTPKPAHQTANTRDLIDFLSEGPPEPAFAPRSASSGAIEPGPAVKPKQSGRWFRRLVGGGSTSERVANIPVPDVPGPAPIRVLGKQKSAQNIRGNSVGGYGAGKVPASPTLSVDTALLPHSSLTRKVSPNRKVVPTWGQDAEPVGRSPALSQASGSMMLSPQRDTFGMTKSPPRQPPEPAPSISSAVSKSSSLRRVPVPKLYPDSDAPSRSEISDHGSQVIPESIPVTKSPESLFADKHFESKPERQRPEKLQEPHIVTAKPIELKPSELSRLASPAEPAGGITSSQAAELRAAIGHATSADECRMLLDLVLGQWGLGRQDPEPSAVPPLSAGCSDFDDADEALAVDMLLGEGTMRSERQWPLTPKDSHLMLREAGIASTLRSSE